MRFSYFTAVARRLSSMLYFAGALYLSACDPEKPGMAAGQLEAPLSITSGDNNYRFIGTINVLDQSNAVVASIDADETSPDTVLVPLIPGEYRSEIPAGYSCAYTGPREGYTGCSFVEATPDPFQIEADLTTHVTLVFDFHFDEEQDVTVVFRVGQAEFGLEPRDDVTRRCGANPACMDGTVCAAVDGSEPACHALCQADEDCEAGQLCSSVAGSDGGVFSLCADPGSAQCTTGSTRSVACGLNGRGQQPEFCVQGMWQSDGPCADPDQCIDGEHNLSLCGQASAGLREDRCVAGQISQGECALLDRMSAGQGHTCAVLSSGSVACWGSGDRGQLGNGSLTSSPLPVVVPGLMDVVGVFAGALHTCAVLASGEVACWGYNIHGQLGNGSTTGSSSPVMVSGITDATSVSLGQLHSCAVRATGEVACWGYNLNYQLGNGTSSVGSTTPTPVLVLSDAVRLAAGQIHNCALRATGQVSCWGYGGFGQLGNGSGGSQAVPGAVMGISDATRIDAGDNHTCVLQATGAISCWGYNATGQLGDGTTTTRTSSVAVGSISDAVHVGTGRGHSCAVHATGDVSCWGDGSWGQLGTGSNTSSLLPVGLPSLSDATVVDLGGLHSCAYRSTGDLWCWGYNFSGQLGNGSTTTSNVPVPVSL